MTITVTDYLEVISSWCFWSEPTWAELKRRYDGRVQFQWKIALMDPSGLPTSREQEQWFYRRSGMMMRSPFMLSTEWYDASLPEWLAPNCVAEAAKDFGFTDDRVRLAISRAALREGKNVSDWKIAAEIGAEAAGMEGDSSPADSGTAGASAAGAFCPLPRSPAIAAAERAIARERDLCMSFLGSACSGNRLASGQ